LNKKRTLVEKIVYRTFLFLFNKTSVLKKCATEALMGDLSDLDILNSLLKFRDCSIMDIMTPRKEICSVDIKSSKDELIKKVKNTCYTKIPTYINDFDNVTGFFYVKDVIFNRNKNFNLEDIKQNILFVPASMKTTDLFVMMKSSKLYLAIVLDEHGGTDGLISMTDLIEELIPNIDNGNEVNSEYTITELSQSKFEMLARTLIKDIEESLKIELRDSEEDYATLSGLILSIAGKIPSVDEVISYKNGIKFIIKDANERYINKIILDLSDYKN